MSGETERESWTVTAAVVCPPCQRLLVASSTGGEPEIARALRERIDELRREQAELARKTA